jgi:hypothetical protein
VNIEVSNLGGRFDNSPPNSLKTQNRKTELAVPRGLEPPTFGLGNRCSIRLSYGTIRAFSLLIACCYHFCYRTVLPTALPNAASMRDTASSCIPGITWLYVSSVKPTVA